MATTENATGLGVSVEGWRPDVLGVASVADVLYVHGWSDYFFTVPRIEGALHDVFLSREPARAAAYASITRWLRGHEPAS